MNNAEWMIKQGKNFSELTCRVNFVTDKFEICLDSKIIGEIVISTISKNPVLVWLDMEHEEPILNDDEKKYLSAVIKPFRNNVTGIHKTRARNSTRCRIFISVSEHDSCELPWFGDGTMYKGMEPGHKYTLKELGL